MSTKDRVIAVIEQHLRLCEELFQLEEREIAMLVSPATTVNFCGERDGLLQRLNRSVAALKEVVGDAQAVRDNPAVNALLRAAQEVIMKTVALGRQNERARLLRGLVPGKHLPSPQRERPHFVAELYRRHGT